MSMAREILFRGKRTDNGEWVTGTPFIYADRCKMIQAVAVHPDFVDDGNVYYSEGFPVDTKTVGQFTGLTDKNGKRIFEGDIVRVERDFWHGENKIEREVFNGVVWYDEKHTCFGIKSEKYRCLPIHGFKGDYVTVIGNIHDPKLLNGKES